MRQFVDQERSLAGGPAGVPRKAAPEAFKKNRSVILAGVHRGIPGKHFLWRTMPPTLTQKDGMFFRKSIDLSQMKQRCAHNRPSAVLTGFNWYGL